MKKIKSLSFLLLIISLVGILTACNGMGLGKNVVQIRSGSMEPTIPLGALVKYEEVEPDELKVGDIIVYEFDEDAVVIHRIAEIIRDEDNGEISFITKGDATGVYDEEPVYPSRILGRVTKWK